MHARRPNMQEHGVDFTIVCVFVFQHTKPLSREIILNLVVMSSE